MIPAMLSLPIIGTLFGSSIPFGFLEPSHFWYFLILGPLTALLVWSRTTASYRISLLVSSEEEVSRARGVLPALIISLLLLTAFCRPHLGFEELSINVHRRNIIVLFDISASMLTDDVAPSRLEFAKRKLYDLIELTRSSGNGDSIGIILFAGEGYLFCPPTADYSTVHTFASSIQTDLISSPGSNIGSALSEAVRSLEEMGAVEPIVVLLSDGGDEQLQLSGISEAFMKMSASFQVFGVGTTRGKPIPRGDGTFLRDRAGEVVISKLEDAALMSLATNLNGMYRQATLSDQDLKLLPHLSSNPASEIRAGIEDSDSIRVYHEVGPVLIIIALLFMGGCFFRKTAPFVILSFVAPLLLQQECYAQSEDEKTPSKIMSAYEAYQAYQSENYAEALVSFEQLYAKNKNDPNIARAYASSLYKNGKYAEAEKVFQSTLQHPTGKYDNLHNLGNSQFMQQDYTSAIQSYEQALKINPHAEDTKKNLELAKALQQQEQEEEEKDSQEEQNTHQQDSQDKSSSSDQQQSENEPSDDEQRGEEKDSSNEKQEEDKSAEESSSPQSDEYSSEKNDGGNTSNEQEAPHEPSEEHQPENMQESSSHSHSEEELSQKEAQAWLDSLPDAPALLGRRVGRSDSRRNPW